MRQVDRKYFGDVQSGRLNSDDSPFVVGANEWVNAENVRTGSTDKGFTGIVESVGGNTALPEPPPASLLYLNIETSSYPLANYRELSETPSNSVGLPISFNTSTIGFIGSNSAQFSAGTWNLSCYFDGSALPQSAIVYAEVLTANINTGVEFVLGTSQNVTIRDYRVYDFSITVTPINLNPNLRILIKFHSNITSPKLYFYPQTRITNKDFCIANSTAPTTKIRQYITIGSVEDTENKRIVYFNYDMSINRFDRIICFYTEQNKFYNVLTSGQVIGGLNFSKDSLIHSAKISDTNTLSWVDGTNNEPRKINIESAIKANDSRFITDATPYIFQLDFSEITLIKPPPIYPPGITKIFSVGATNFIQFQSFEFSYEFQYYDNEISVPGTYSLGTRLNHTKATDNFNAINVVMNVQQYIQETIKKVSLIVRISDGKPGGGTSAFIVKTWSRLNQFENQEINNHNNNTAQLSYIYHNDITGEPIAADDVLRPFDNVPIFSQTHEVSKSRFFLGNNIEGYDTPKSTSLNVLIGQRFITDATSLTIFPGNYKAGFYNGGGWFNSGTQWSACGSFVWITGIAGYATGYYYVNGTAQYDGNDANVNSPLPCPPTVNFTDLTFVGNSNNDPWNYLQNMFGHGDAYTQPYGINSWTGDGPSRWGSTQTILTGFAVNMYDTLAHKSTYKLGVVFYDYAMRKCGVCNTNNNPVNYNLFNTAASASNTHSNINEIFISIPSINEPDIVPGDSLIISMGTIYNGTYVVNSILSKNVSRTAPFTEYRFYVDGTVSGGSLLPINLSVYRKLGTTFNTPVRDYNYVSGYGVIQWSLGANANLLQEIPEWAYYYSVVKTLNLRTRFFLESSSTSSFYITRDSSGVFQYTSKSYVLFGAGIALSTQALVYAGLGYTYSEGDMCILFDEVGNIYDIPVIGQNGNYIHLANTDIGSLIPTLGNSKKLIFQIYNVYKSSEQEPYYEFAQMFPVINPGKITRSYSTQSGIIPADSYIIQRSATSLTYYANAMSPNDTFWKRWDSDAGKVNIVTTLGQTDKNTNITWSDTYISGTQINGSNTFRLGSETFVSDDCGSITKLQLTSKVQDQGQGSVMLALCNSEINSMYLGETQIADSTGKTQFFSATTNVVSTINILKGNYGCINPESVTQYRGKVYFVDISNGRVVQYSDNGLDAISNIKMSRFWKNWSYKYQSMTKADIEALGDRPFIFSIVDSGHDELLISLPKLSTDPPKGFLPDYPTTPYPFDILDYEGKTIVYSLGSAAQVYPHWQGAFTFTTENFVTLQNRLFSFKNGNMYEHNQDLQNTFYGTYSPSKIMFTSNIMQQVPKIYDNFLVESNLMPDFVYFYNNYPYIQTSDLTDVDFRDVEGIWYASILRNKIVPTATGFTTNGLLTAEVMKNTNMYVEARFSPTSTPLELRLLQLGMSISKGHPSL